MSGRPWCKFYPRDFLEGVDGLSCEQIGAYTVLLMLMYRAGGGLDDDPHRLARATKNTLQRWKRLRRELLDLGKLTITADGLLSNGRVIREMLAQGGERTEQQRAGRVGGLRRAARAATPLPPAIDWGDDAAPDDHNASENLTENLPRNFEKTCEVLDPVSCEINELTSPHGQACSEIQTLQSPVPPPESPSTRQPPTCDSRAKRRGARANVVPLHDPAVIDGRRSRVRPAHGTRMAEDWQPSEADRRYAIDHHTDPDRVAEEMRNYWLSVSGSRACRVDWSRTFRNRVLVLEDRGTFRLNRPVPGAPAGFDPAKLTGFFRLKWELDEADRRARAAGAEPLDPLDPPLLEGRRHG